MTDYQIVTAMREMGGSFVQKLAQAWYVADDQNQARIKATWPEYFAKYQELAELRQAQEPTR